jgi:ankyrin repeat protein
MAKKHVENSLMNLPRTLDETYQRMLVNIAEDYADEAASLLKWLAYSNEPLTLAELATAAGIRLSADDRDEVADPEDVDYESPVNILEGLVIVIPHVPYGNNAGQATSGANTSAITEDMTKPQGSNVQPQFKLRLAHFSVKEYLVSDRILVGPAKVFHLSTPSGDNHLAQSCLAYLLHYSTYSGKTSDGYSDSVTFPLLNYAARLWPYHFRQSGSTDNRRALSLLSTEATKLSWLRIHNPDDQREPDYDPGDSLYFASYFGMVTLVRSLLDNGAEPNARGGGCGDALQAASYKGHESIVQMLLDKGAHVNAQGGEFGNALQAASSYGRDTIVEILLENAADVNMQGGFYGNALQAASYCGNTKTVQILLDRGADVNRQGGVFRSALRAASYCGNATTVEILLERGALVNAPDGELGDALRAASSLGDEPTVRLLLDRGADVNAQGTRPDDTPLRSHYTGSTALGKASEGGHYEVVKLLLERGADANLGGGHGKRPLHMAAENGHSTSVRILVDAGADVNAQSHVDGSTALDAVFTWCTARDHYEIWEEWRLAGHYEVLQILIDAGADVSMLRVTEARLARASSRGHHELVRVLRILLESVL